MKVKCIEDMEYERMSVDDSRSITEGEILETDNSGTIECLRDFKGDLIISLDDEDFYEYFEKIEEEYMENKNIIKCENTRFKDKEVEYGMLFDTGLGLCMMSQVGSMVYKLVSLEDGNRIDDMNYCKMMISDVEGYYLGYGTITVSDFRKEL